MSAFDSIKSVKNGKTIYKILIGGKWVESGGTFDIKSPVDGLVVGSVQKASKDDAEKAVIAAFSSRQKIAGMPASERTKLLSKMEHLLEQNKSEFIDIICKESGKTKSLSEGEVNASIERLGFAADEARSIGGKIINEDMENSGKGFALVSRQPMGVVLAITPFNYPLFAAVSKIAPALASGNSLVVKPASADPICTLMLGKIMQDAGLPEGVVNIITGGGSEIGDYLCSHPKIDMISFTGGSAAGKHIASIAGMKKLHLELGGKAPAIVLDDCDMNLAVKECVAGSLKFYGQRCDAISRILVINSIADRFVSGVLEEMKKWKFGDPREDGTSVGPLINDNASSFVDELVKDAVKKGAKILCGGKKYDHGYYEPTVIDNVNESMRIAWEETFGPVVTIMRVKDYEEAISISNKSEYGLDACVFTKDINKAMDAGRRIEAGAVTINALPRHGIGLFTFGGDKESGMGRQGIRHSIEEMTKPHTIVIHL